MSRERGAWTDAEALRDRLRRDWDSGRLPRALLGAGDDFPLRIALRGPTASELGPRFDEARAWIAGLSAGECRPGYRLEWREVNHRQLGRNSLPVAAIFDLAADAVAFAGRRREAVRLVVLAREIESAFPRLANWVAEHPLVVLEHGEEWPALLGALGWFKAHPRPGRYLRQVDAPGVHSKFIEGRRGLLSELLDLVLAPEDYDPEAAGAQAFARRYGLREKEAIVRFRCLDPLLAFGLSLRGGAFPVAPRTGLSQADAPGADAPRDAPTERDAAGLAQIGLGAADFARLFDPSAMPPFDEVFVTENEINFLAFPERPSALILFGAGYGFSSLAEAAWLKKCRIRYWGDLDTHGFAILNQFRAVFPEAESFLMDRDTLLGHRALWTSEAAPTKAELPRLSAEERTLYDDLRADRLGPAVRLEQERVGFGWLESQLRPSTR
ncbi:MAG TPA: DUF3322 domain-containing protein [Rectinemataceae bacterium]|nr:DUF3322 domain-containing protein [Rectinemataceae bacterium]